MIEDLARRGDYVHLGDEDEYSAYFQHLNRVFAYLAAWYQKLVTGGNTEAQVIRNFLDKILSTVRLLHIKYRYRTDHQLVLDLNDSGLPHWTSINELESDLALRGERQKDLPSRRIVQELMLEEMLLRGQDPVALLPKMAEVQLNEDLDEGKLIFTFTPGNAAIVENGSPGGVLNCIFSWLCYDKMRNRPYVYIMAFDFDGSAEELRSEINEGDFVETIRRLGDREAPLAVLASDIDEAMLRVFPKIIKRIQLGPIICPKFSVPGDQESLVGWLNEFGDPGDFALLLESAVIVSNGEFSPRRGWFSLGAKRVRQVFAVSEDVLASEHQANEVRQILMLPHRVLQQIGSDPAFIELFERHTKVTYDPQGGLYVV